MSDVILFQPAVEEKFRLVTMPLGLLYISSKLDAEGYKIKIIDQRIDKNWKKTFRSELKKSSPTCIGVSSITGKAISFGLDICNFVRNEDSKIPIVWGGPHPSIVPMQAIENKFVDIVCEGEGDETFYDLVKLIEKSRNNKYEKNLRSVKGIYFKDNGSIKYTGKRNFVDLNSLPLPPYHLIDLNDYKNYNTSWYNNDFAFSVVTSRGCTRDCAYCYNTRINACSWRALSSGKTIELLKFLYDKYGSKYFLFMDDSFFLNQKRINEIMNGVTKEHMDVKMDFVGAGLIEFAMMKTKELRMIEKAGVNVLQFGLDSGSLRIIKLMRKFFNTPRNVLAVNRKLAKFASLVPYYNLIAGYPTETIDDLKMTLKLITRIYNENKNARFLPLFLFIPYPGTDAFKLAVEHGLNPPTAFEDWSSMWVYTMNQDEIKLRPWLTKEFIEFYKKISMVLRIRNSYLNLSFDHPELEKIRSNFFTKIVMKLYRPLFEYRFNHCLYDFMPEAKIAIWWADKSRKMLE